MENLIVRRSISSTLYTLRIKCFCLLIAIGLRLLRKPFFLTFVYFWLKYWAPRNRLRGGQRRRQITTERTNNWLSWLLWPKSIKWKKSFWNPRCLAKVIDLRAVRNFTTRRSITLVRIFVEPKSFRSWILISRAIKYRQPYWIYLLLNDRKSCHQRIKMPLVWQYMLGSHKMVSFTEI